LFLQGFFSAGTTGEGHAGTTEHETPTTTNYVPFPSDQSRTHIFASQMEHEGTTPSSGRSTSDRADQDQGVDAEEDSIDITIASFPGSSHVTSTGTLETTFLVDENLVPIKIEKIPGTIKKCFNYFI